ncbi:MAG: flagellin FliC [Rhodocyclaceae bacterium]|nr:flagellin FliC [Rhodocyclaceae bacterium]
MAQQINTNIYSMNAQRNLNKNSLGLASAIERLSSGLRVNSSKDDAAGLAVGLKMEASARGISASIRIASDQISVAQTGDGALQTVGDILLRMSELKSQSANTTLGTTEVGYLGQEFSALAGAVAAIQSAATINGITTIATAVTIGNVLTSVGATDISAAIDSVASKRAAFGASMNTLEFQIQSYETSRENQMAARSRIMDADFAVETSNLSRFQILQQAGTAMVAQANAVPQNVLSLLR